MLGNSIHMQLQMLFRVGNRTVRYEDIQRHARRYKVYVRRTQDNFTVRCAAAPLRSSACRQAWGPSLPCGAAQVGRLLKV